MVVDRINIIEKKYHLYDFYDQRGIPVWDILRYDIIKIIESRYTPGVFDVKRNSIIPIVFGVLSSIFPLIDFLFSKRKKYLFVVSARYSNETGKYFDRSGQGILDYIDNDTCVVDMGYNKPVAYKTVKHIPVFIESFYSRVLKVKLPNDYVEDLSRKINEEFGREIITADDINQIYSRFLGTVKVFDFIISCVKPKKVFVSYGRFKAAFFAAKKKQIPTVLIQHALIEASDYALCGTCPNVINSINADVLLTYGSYWGQYMSHLTKVIPLGNDFLCNDRFDVDCDNSILFISSLYQGRVLPKLALDFAILRPGLRVVYKLHPAEFAKANDFIDMFRECKNIRVVSSEVDTSILIKRSKLVVMISSTVFYEALSAKRPVAIWDYPDFSSLTRMHKGFVNSYSIGTAAELSELADDVVFRDGDPMFFEPLNRKIVESVLS